MCHWLQKTRGFSSSVNGSSLREADGGGHNEQAYYRVPGFRLDDHHLDSWGELTDVDKVALGNRHLGIEVELTATPRIGLWRFPVESVSNSEGGIETLYQASCLLPLLPFSLAPSETATLNLIWQVRRLTTEKAKYQKQNIKQEKPYEQEMYTHNCIGQDSPDHHPSHILVSLLSMGRVPSLMEIVCVYPSPWFILGQFT